MGLYDEIQQQLEDNGVNSGTDTSSSSSGSSSSSTSSGGSDYNDTYAPSEEDIRRNVEDATSADGSSGGSAGGDGSGSGSGSGGGGGSGDTSTEPNVSDINDATGIGGSSDKAFSEPTAKTPTAPPTDYVAQARRAGNQYRPGYNDTYAPSNADLLMEQRQAAGSEQGVEPTGGTPTAPPTDYVAQAKRAGEEFHPGHNDTYAPTYSDLLMTQRKAAGRDQGLEQSGSTSDYLNFQMGSSGYRRTERGAARLLEQQWLKANPGYTAENVRVVRTPSGGFATELTGAGVREQQNRARETATATVADKYGVSVGETGVNVMPTSGGGYSTSLNQAGEERLAGPLLEQKWLSLNPEYAAKDVRVVQGGEGYTTELTSSGVRRQQQLARESVAGSVADRYGVGVGATGVDILPTAGGGYAGSLNSVGVARVARGLTKQADYNGLDQRVDKAFGVDLTPGSDYTVEPVGDGSQASFRPTLTAKGRIKAAGAPENGETWLDANVINPASETVRSSTGLNLPDHDLWQSFKADLRREAQIHREGQGTLPSGEQARKTAEESTPGMVGTPISIYAPSKADIGQFGGRIGELNPAQIALGLDRLGEGAGEYVYNSALSNTPPLTPELAKVRVKAKQRRKGQEKTAAMVGGAFAAHEAHALTTPGAAGELGFQGGLVLLGAGLGKAGEAGSAAADLARGGELSDTVLGGVGRAGDRLGGVATKFGQLDRAQLDLTFGGSAGEATKASELADSLRNMERAVSTRRAEAAAERSHLANQAELPPQEPYIPEAPEGYTKPAPSGRSVSPGPDFFRSGPTAAEERAFASRGGSESSVGLSPREMQLAAKQGRATAGLTDLRVATGDLSVGTAGSEGASELIGAGGALASAGGNADPPPIESLLVREEVNRLRAAQSGPFDIGAAVPGAETWSNPASMGGRTSFGTAGLALELDRLGGQSQTPSVSARISGAESRAAAAQQPSTSAGGTSGSSVSQGSQQYSGALSRSGIGQMPMSGSAAESGSRSAAATRSRSLSNLRGDQMLDVSPGAFTQELSIQMDDFGFGGTEPIGPISSEPVDVFDPFEFGPGFDRPPRPKSEGKKRNKSSTKGRQQNQAGEGSVLGDAFGAGWINKWATALAGGGIEERRTPKNVEQLAEVHGAYLPLPTAGQVNPSKDLTAGLEAVDSLFFGGSDRGDGGESEVRSSKSETGSESDQWGWFDASKNKKPKKGSSAPDWEEWLSL